MSFNPLTEMNQQHQNGFMYEPILLCEGSKDWLEHPSFDIPEFDVTFLDPPFNQGKVYRVHNDRMSEIEYWDWMTQVCGLIFNRTKIGGALYFMQREKNCEKVLSILKKTGWYYQNLIIWKKLTSAVPCVHRFGKSFQIIVFATKGSRPKSFNRLRIDPPLPEGYSPRENGIYLTDVWDDIRELTSGYFAGAEPLREQSGERFHKQQSPIALLLRIILSSSMPGDCVFDPFAGTGTTLCVAQQLNRVSIGIEIDKRNCDRIKERVTELRSVDNILRFRSEYVHTPNLSGIWPSEENIRYPEVSMTKFAGMNR